MDMNYSAADYDRATGLGSLGTVAAPAGPTAAQEAYASELKFRQQAAYAGAASTAMAGLSKAAEYGSAYIQARSQADTVGANIALVKQQMSDALDLGEYTKSRIFVETSRTIGAQRSAAASSGMVVDEGSAAQVTAATLRQADADTRTADQNMRRQVAAQQITMGGLKAQKTMLAAMGRVALVNAAASTVSSLAMAAYQVKTAPAATTPTVA